MLANTRVNLQPCSTTGRTQTTTRRSRGRCQHLQTYAKQDTFCKDVVNVTKEVKAEGVSRISFLGAEGHEIQIDCPKVRMTDGKASGECSPSWRSFLCSQALLDCAGHIHIGGWPTK